MRHPAIERGLIERPDDSERKRMEKENIQLRKDQVFATACGEFFLRYADELRARGKKRRLSVEEMASRGVTFPVREQAAEAA